MPDTKEQTSTTGTSRVPPRRHRRAAALVVVAVGALGLAALIPTVSAAAGAPAPRTPTASTGTAAAPGVTPVPTPPAAPTGTPADGVTAAARPAAVPKGFVTAASAWSTPSRGYVLGTKSCSDGPCWALLTTGDSGTTWQQRSLPAKHIRPREVVHLTVTPNDQSVGAASVFLSNGRWVYASHDGGGTWQHVPLKGAKQSVAVGDMAASPSRVYAVVGDGARQGGATRLFVSHLKSKRMRPAPGVRIDGNAVNVGGGWDVAVRNRSVAVALGVVFESSAYWTAADGATFTSSTPPCTNDQVPSIGAVTAARVDVLCSYNPGLGHMFKDLYTAPLGGPFTKTGSAPDLGITEQYVSTRPGENTITAIGGASILYRSAATGWDQPLFLPDALEFSSLQYADSSVGYVLWGGPISHRSTLYRTADGGHTWTPLLTSG